MALSSRGVSPRQNTRQANPGSPAPRPNRPLPNQHDRNKSAVFEDFYAYAAISGDITGACSASGTCTGTLVATETWRTDPVVAEFGGLTITSDGVWTYTAKAVTVSTVDIVSLATSMGRTVNLTITITP